MVLLEKIFEYLEITGTQERLIESGKVLLITLILSLTSYLVTQKIIMKFDDAFLVKSSVAKIFSS